MSDMTSVFAESPERFSSRLVLIPAATRVAVELQSEFGGIPPVMLPLGGRPAFTHIAEPWLKEGWCALLALHEDASSVVEYLHYNPTPGIYYVDVGPTKSLGETVLAALDGFPGEITDLIINFGDTIVSGVPSKSDYLIYGETDNLYRWTSFKAAQDGRIIEIHDRFQEKAGNPPVFTGFFRIGTPNRFRQYLRESLQSGETVDHFYNAITAYFGDQPSQTSFSKSNIWWDLGHLDTYYQNRQNYWTNLRSFNSVHINKSKGVIRKESSNKKKLVDEISWYLKLPKEISYLSPRIFDYSLDPFQPFVELEYYGYPTLSEMYLFGDHDAGFWVQVLSAIHSALSAMAKYQLHTPNAAESLREIYINKTISRIKNSIQLPHLSSFEKCEIVCNGFRCPSIDHVLTKLESTLLSMNLLSSDSICIVHGDLCLSNILYDRKNTTVRLIDPRGSFGDWSIYGDPRYDIAKLHHSMDGDYDLIVNKQFTLQEHGNHLDITPHLLRRHAGMKNAYRRFFDNQVHLPSTKDEIQLLTGLLFVSMVPLHDDQPQAQRAFLATGLRYLSRYF